MDKKFLEICDYYDKYVMPNGMTKFQTCGYACRKTVSKKLVYECVLNNVSQVEYKSVPPLATATRSCYLSQPKQSSELFGVAIQ